MTEIERLAAAIKKISEKYLTAVVKNKDEDGIAKWSLRLADYSTRLAVLVTPVAKMAAREVADLNPAVKAPDFGDSEKMSGELYGDWVSEWVQRTFPEAYRDWPPTVYSVTPQALASAAASDDCLAQVTAAGVFGPPNAITAGLGDYSLYTALVGENTDDGQFVHRVYHMGKLVGELKGGPDVGLDYAHSLGFNW